MRIEAPLVSLLLIGRSLIDLKPNLKYWNNLCLYHLFFNPSLKPSSLHPGVQASRQPGHSRGVLPLPLQQQGQPLRRPRLQVHRRAAHAHGRQRLPGRQGRPQGGQAKPGRVVQTL